MAALENTMSGPRRNWLRGLEWLAVAAIGAAIIGHLDAWGVDGYTARWAGACFKVAAGAWGGYRISRDIARIDPSSTAGLGVPDPRAFATLHMARALIIAAAIIGVCVAV